MTRAGGGMTPERCDRLLRAAREIWNRRPSNWNEADIDLDDRAAWRELHAAIRKAESTFP